ncbi:hypothetical protein AKJ40_00715 [candidate division MSBL1 archaeon SCGC-AAA259M10]|uniref:Uncharacterized protein n=1 Tax=candidate division MSBL1 archaeon SCGC-AAA259M10 TaxID=1698270 RepID=A0A133V2T1_9EURY|nr:hypothetical protein AKJ40_00715 [candidate division MSBL1 archaeon SCGC-AAA259M10]
MRVPSLEYRIANALDDIPVPYAKNVGSFPKNYEKIAEFVVLNAEFEPQATICGLDLSGDTSKCLGALLLWINRWVEEKKEMDIVLVVKDKAKQGVLEEKSSLLEAEIFDGVLHKRNLSSSKLAECLGVDQSNSSTGSKGGEKS